VVTLQRIAPDHPDFLALVHALDAELAIRDGDDHPFYAQFNTLESIRHAVLARVDDAAVGCGAFKPYTGEIMEIKRMYVKPPFRGQGIAAALLAELEQWGREAGYGEAILETGFNQPEAIRLYAKCGYHRIPNYGPYANVANSVCFGKALFDWMFKCVNG
jgi:GNAT superfamily N-acetyltransferase